MMYDFDKQLKARNEWILEQNHGIMPQQPEVMQKFIDAWNVKRLEDMFNDPEKTKEVVDDFLKKRRYI